MKKSPFFPTSLGPQVHVNDQTMTKSPSEVPPPRARDAELVMQNAARCAHGQGWGGSRQLASGYFPFNKAPGPQTAVRLHMASGEGAAGVSTRLPPKGCEILWAGQVLCDCWFPWSAEWRTPAVSCLCLSPRNPQSFCEEHPFREAGETLGC